MATVAAATTPSSSTLDPQSITPRQQKKLFRSISKFLSGGRSRPKLAGSGSASTTATPSNTASNRCFHSGNPTPSTSASASAAAFTYTSVATGSSVVSSSGEGAAYVDNVPLEDVGRGVDRDLPALGEPRSHLTAGTSSYEENDELYPHSRRSVVSSVAPTRLYHDHDHDYSIGADTDASIRPISPASHAPSSIASSSFAPTQVTHRSSTSTKPTTHLSIDSGGANRIAVVPGTGMLFAAHQAHPTILASSSPLASVPPVIAPPFGDHLQSDNTSAATSPGPSTPTGEIVEPTSMHLDPIEPLTPLSIDSSLLVAPSTTTVPGHTLVHPRNNPHPNGPPPDNASMITLASSSFAPSVFHRSQGASTSTNPVTGLQRAWKEGGAGSTLGIAADEDASVRALAPSRRASDESLGCRSTWSAAVGRVSLGGAPLAFTCRTPSIRTTGTGGDELEATGQNDETEAQKVVRREGIRNEAVVAANTSTQAPPGPSNAFESGTVRSAPFLLGSGGLSRYLSATDSIKRGSPSISSSLRGIAPAPSEKGFGDDEDDNSSYIGTERDDEDAAILDETEDHIIVDPGTVSSRVHDESSPTSSSFDDQKRKSLTLSTKLGVAPLHDGEGSATPRIEKNGAFSD